MYNQFMENNLLKVKEGITTIIKESPIASDVEHAERTLKWLLVLKPNADDALQVAAYGHDIDRGVTKITNKDLADMKDYDKDRKEHSERSARFLAELLVKNGLSSAFIQKVKALVEKHEVGGDEESDILRDADSIAYFDYNIPLYLQRNGEEKGRYKINYMYDRASEGAKIIIKTLKFDDENIQKIVNEELNKK